MSKRSYLLLVALPARRLGETTFAVESAFAHHLRLLRDRLGGLAAEMTLMCPAMSAAQYEEARATLAVVDEPREGIRFVPAYDASADTPAFLKGWPRFARSLLDEVRRADVVHAGVSHLSRPMEFPALLLGRALGKKTISVADIDHKGTSGMRRAVGELSLAQYVRARALHDPWHELQHHVAVRAFSLVLLKGKAHAARYGLRENVKTFLDAAFSAEHVLSDAALAAKVARVQGDGPLALAYCGRLVAYKGVRHMMQAFAHAVHRGAHLVFHVVGDGPESAGLAELARQLGVAERVLFHGAIAFGPALFAQLHAWDIALAAPLRQDTPRSALDAAASGQLTVAYDTPYYRELRDEGAPVELVPWSDVAALASRLVALDADRARVADAMQRAVRFARANTQEAWLERRVAWTRALFDGAEPELLLRA